MTGRLPAYHYPGYPTSDTELITVQYPAAWVPFVTGIISEADYPDLWDSPPDDLTDQLSNLQYLLAEPVTMDYPTRAFMPHFMSIVDRGNAIVLVLNSLDYLNGVYRQNPGANNDRFTHSFFLAAGTYRLHCLATTTTNAGKLQVSIDDAEIVIEDFYSASTTRNVDFDWQIVLATAGLHRLDGVCNGKTASSSGYNLNINYLYIKPTSDV